MTRLRAHLALDTPAGFLFWLTLVCGVFLLLRLLVSATVGVDDVEQAIFAQGWALGYNPLQPPLYTWLLLVCFKLFGVSLFSLSLLRYTLMFLTFYFLYLSARRLVQEPRLAALAAFSPLLIYYIGWQAHQGFTHTTLLTAFACATLYMLLRLIESGSWRCYIALGVVAGLGMLSKYSYVLVAASLFLAGLLQEGSRRRLLNVRLLASIAVAVVIVLPAVRWMLAHHLALKDDIMHQSAAGMRHAGVLHTWWLILRSSIDFLFPFWLVAPLLLPQALRLLPQPQSGADFDGGRLLGHYHLIIYALLFGGALLGALIFITNRWMHPVLILFPLYYFYRAGQLGVSTPQLRRLTLCLAGVAVTVVVAWLVQPFTGKALCGRCRLFEPYPALAQDIAATGYTRGTIVAADEHIGGNLRMRFGDSRLLSLPYPFYTPPPSTTDGQCLLVWNAARGETLPVAMAEFVRSLLGMTLRGDEPVHVVEGVNHNLRDRALRLAFILLPRGAGDCR